MNAFSRLVDGTCGPRQKSMKCGPERVLGEDLAGLLVDELALHELAHLLVLLEPFRLRRKLALVRQIALLDLPHLRLDLLEVFGRERRVALEIVVEAGFGRRADAELGFREQFQHGSASRCAVEWRYTSSASGFFEVRICSDASPSSGRVRSNKSPLTRATTASSASRGLMDFAMSRGVVPAATCCVDPSGRVTVMLLMLLISRYRVPALHSWDSGSFSVSWDGERGTELMKTLPLVDARAAGDAAAFSELVERYERKIYRLAKHITQNDEDAEDVLQESFMKAYTHLDSFQGESKFYTWLVRIAVNEALMKLRKRKSDRTVSLDEPQDTGEELVTARDRRLGRRPGEEVFPGGTGRDPGQGGPEPKAKFPHRFRTA